MGSETDVENRKFTATQIHRILISNFSIDVKNNTLFDRGSGLLRSIDTSHKKCANYHNSLCYCF